MCRLREREETFDREKESIHHLRLWWFTLFVSGLSSCTLSIRSCRITALLVYCTERDRYGCHSGNICWLKPNWTPVRLSPSLSLSLAFRVSFIFISFSVWNAVYYSVVEAAAASSIDGLVGSYDGSPFLSPVSDCDIFFHYLCLSGGWRSGSPSLLYSFSSCWKGHVEAKRIKRKAIVSTVFSSFFSSSFKSLNNRSLLYWFLPFERRDHALRAKRSHRSSFPSSYNLFSHSFSSVFSAQPRHWGRKGASCFIESEDDWTELAWG